MGLPFKAIVFDLDGTLIDTAPDLLSAVNRLLSGAGRRELALDDVKMMIGDGARNLVERVFGATGEAAPETELDELTRRFLGFYEGYATDHSRPYPGVVRTLDVLKGEGRALGLCTNKPYAATIAILDGLGLAGYFSSVVAGDSIAGVRKPDPGHLLAVLDDLGARPGESVMVGDNHNDVAAARGAGMAVIVVSYGYSRIPASELGGDAVVDSFTELPGVLGRLP